MTLLNMVESCERFQRAMTIVGLERRKKLNSGLFPATSPGFWNPTDYTIAAQVLAVAFVILGSFATSWKEESGKLFVSPAV